MALFLGVMAPRNIGSDSIGGYGHAADFPVDQEMGEDDAD